MELGNASGHVAVAKRVAFVVGEGAGIPMLDKGLLDVGDETWGCHIGYIMLQKVGKCVLLV